MEGITELILATGAIGTSAFGIVEGLKFLWFIGEGGFGLLFDTLGPIRKTFEVAYGPEYEVLLRALYRGDQKELARVLRQGVRIGLTESNAKEISDFLGSYEADKLADAARQVENGQELPQDLRNILGRFELAADTRIDASLTLANSRYITIIRTAASFISISIAMAIGYLQKEYLRALLVGIAAVPLAPIAKDLASAIQSASKAIRAKI